MKTQEACVRDCTGFFCYVLNFAIGCRKLRKMLPYVILFSYPKSTKHIAFVYHEVYQQNSMI